jgi:hypothetical protein
MFRFIAHQDDIVRGWRLTCCILLICATNKHKFSFMCLLHVVR